MIAIPMRSVVYRFGNDAAVLAEAPTVAADALLFDLEDSTAANEKPAAREAIARVLREQRFVAPCVLVRINGLDTPWHEDDLRALAGLKIDGVMLPKTESAEAVRALARLADEAGLRAEARLWAMIETPAGVLRAAEIAAASPRLAGIAVGTGDLSRGLHGYPRFSVERLPLLPALGQCLLAARAAGVIAIDGAYRDPREPAAFEAACRASRELGFDGRTMADAALAPIADRAYGPTADELDWARRVVAAIGAVAPGDPARVDGRLVEPGYLAEAQRLLALDAASRRE